MDNSKIMALRMKNKLSVNEMSKILDVSKERIRSWKNNESEPTINELKKLSIFFEGSTDYLMGLEKVEPKSVTKNVTPVEEKTKVINVKGGTEVLVKKPVLNKWFFLSFPILGAFILLFMAIPFEQNVSFLSLMLTSYSGRVLFPGLYAVAIILIVILSLMIVYFIIYICLSKNNQAKLNIPNAAILGATGLVNFILAIYSAVMINNASSYTLIILAFIFWFVLSLYSIALSILLIVGICKHTDKEIVAAEKNYSGMTEVEIYKAKQKEKEDLLAYKSQSKQERFEKSPVNGFTSKSIFFLLPIPILSAIAIIFNMVLPGHGNSTLILLFIEILWLGYYITILCLPPAKRFKMILPTNIIAGISIVFSIIMMIFVYTEFDSINYETSGYHAYSVAAIGQIVYFALFVVLFGLSFILNKKKKEIK